MLASLDSPWFLLCHSSWLLLKPSFGVTASPTPFPCFRSGCQEHFLWRLQRLTGLESQAV